MRVVIAPPKIASRPFKTFERVILWGNIGTRFTLISERVSDGKGISIPPQKFDTEISISFSTKLEDRARFAKKTKTILSVPLVRVK